MPKLDTAYVLAKLIEVHHDLRHITSAQKAAEIFLPAMIDAVGFEYAMLKVRDEDGLFRGYILSADGTVTQSIRATNIRSYLHFMSKAERISNSYFASHEIRVWDSLPGSQGWERVCEAPQWEPGKWHPEDALLVPVHNQNAELIGVLWPDMPIDGQIPDKETVQILELFASLAVAAIEIRRLLELNQAAAITDGLTHLYTHRYFQECLERIVNEANRHGDNVSLLMMDLDRFKRINDQHGHVVGDQVLRQISEILAVNARASDIIARYGGEEFAEILPRTDLAGAVNRAKRIKQALSECWENHLPIATISIGVASFPCQVSDNKSLIEAADEALLQAKRMGRNRICIYQRRRKAANM